MMSKRIHAFVEQKELIEELSKSISQQLQYAIDKTGKASLIVSGGSTPKSLFERLRKSEIEWEKVTVGLCDERWVCVEDEDSNENLVKRYLLQENASKAAFVGMYNDKMSAQEAEEECSQTIEEKLYPFDVVILGMGNDGHTASLFPQNDKLAQAFNLNQTHTCISIEPQNAPYIRMSLTLKAILSAKHLYLHIEGKEKLSVYTEAIGSEGMYEMPIRSVLFQETTDVEVYFHE